MYPILFHLHDPEFFVRTYTAVVLVGSAVAFAFAWPRLRRIEGVEPRTIRRICLWLAVGAYVGGRLHQVLNNWEFLRAKVATDGLTSDLVFGGMHAGGAVIGLAIAAAIVLPRHRVPALRFADAATPAAALGMAFGRFACFLNGCCYGTPCTAPWCLSFPAPSNVWDHHRALRLVADDSTWSLPIHPLQIYFSIAALVVMAVALWLEPRKRHHGQVVFVALFLFSVSNAVLEPFRENFALRAYWFGVPQLTWVAWGTALAALIALALVSRGDVRRTGYAGAPVAP